MSKSKVKLAFIENDAKRRAAYKKCKEDLLNKVSELTTLCGINACTIIYSKFDYEPDVWKNTLAAQQVISQFKRLPEMMKERKMLNQEAELDKLSPTDLDDLGEKIEKKMMGENSRLNGNSKKKVILDGDEAQSNPAPP
ncbi:hypothetical protein M9H77_28156 [Catharanthus roseus]|uniref:Uncharacterized protein n=1 Tax=Catharanthus roseus TaxID=4058 RepID=A0ACC0AIU3_CATRO|nr:hypothetical protein M9H77_28156 [Catharanthus roseus]